MGLALQSAPLAGFINSPHPLEARQPFGWWWEIMAGGHMKSIDTIDTNQLRETWIPAFFNEQATVDELNRLIIAGCRARKKKWVLLVRAANHMHDTVDETVRQIKRRGGLLFLAHGTPLEKSIDRGFE